MFYPNVARLPFPIKQIVGHQSPNGNALRHL